MLPAQQGAHKGGTKVGGNTEYAFFGKSCFACFYYETGAQELVTGRGNTARDENETRGQWMSD